MSCNEPVSVSSKLLVLVFAILAGAAMLAATREIKELRQTITMQKLQINSLMLKQNTDDIVCVQWLLNANLKQARERICKYQKEPK